MCYKFKIILTSLFFCVAITAVNSREIKSSNIQKPVENDMKALREYWIKVVESSDSVMLVRLDDIKENDDLNIESLTKKTFWETKKLKEFKKITVKPLEAISAEGGNSLVLFMKGEKINGIFRLISEINSVNVDGSWQFTLRGTKGETDKTAPKAPNLNNEFMSVRLETGTNFDNHAKRK